MKINDEKGVMITAFNEYSVDILDISGRVTSLSVTMSNTDSSSSNGGAGKGPN